MTQMHWALLVSALCVALIAAAVFARRGGDAPRDVRLLLGAGAALGGTALLLLSFGIDS